MDISAIPLRIDIAAYFDKYSVQGKLRIPSNVRLSDFLNNGRHKKNESDFLPIEEIMIVYSEASRERYKQIYLSKGSILAVSLEDGGIARGIQVAQQQKRYPFVDKRQTPVLLVLPSNVVMGNIHLIPNQSTSDFLGQTATFIPMTDFKIRAEDDDYWRKAPFGVVNKHKIISLRDMGNGSSDFSAN